jgi:hypothetical protein
MYGPVTPTSFCSLMYPSTFTGQVLGNGLLPEMQQVVERCSEVLVNVEILMHLTTYLEEGLI